MRTNNKGSQHILIERLLHQPLKLEAVNERTSLKHLASRILKAYIQEKRLARRQVLYRSTKK